MMTSEQNELYFNDKIEVEMTYYNGDQVTLHVDQEEIARLLTGQSGYTGYRELRIRTAVGLERILYIKEDIEAGEEGIIDDEAWRNVFKLQRLLDDTNDYKAGVVEKVNSALEFKRGNKE